MTETLSQDPGRFDKADSGDVPKGLDAVEELFRGRPTVPEGDGKCLPSGPAIAYSASNRVVFSGKVARTRQPEFFNSIITFQHEIGREPQCAILLEQRRTPASLNLLLEQIGTNSGLTMALSY